jgi:radical SAM superfamily enzyme YgiQ (UPF0313 family)
MRVHLVNPSDLAFGVGVITPRWLYVIAGATPERFGDPVVVDETLEPFDPETIVPGDVVGIGIHTFNSLRGYEVGREARARGATVVFGGVHASLYPDEARELGGAHAVVKGDGDAVWPAVLADCANGGPEPVYDAGRIEASEFATARWDLMPPERYMWGSVQTVRGCPKHCSFCSVWRMDGQRPRQRTSDLVVEELVQLRRLGYRFVFLADDNFYPVTLRDLQVADKRADKTRLHELEALRAERFELMSRLEELPADMVFFTQITMEVADDPEYMDAMRRARIRGALVGIETVTQEGLKAIYKNFNSAGDSLVQVLHRFRRHGLHVLGSFIFGLPTDKPDTFDATVELADEADIAFAQFVMLSPLPGTLDFQAWEKALADDETRIAGQPLTRYWLIPQLQRPKLYIPHPTMSPQEIRERTQQVWDRFYSFASIWKRSRVTPNLQSRLAFLLISKLYRQMYANTGIATDSARVQRSTTWARRLARPCRRLFVTTPMPELEVPKASLESASPAPAVSSS